MKSIFKKKIKAAVDQNGSAINVEVVSEGTDYGELHEKLQKIGFEEKPKTKAQLRAEEKKAYKKEMDEMIKGLYGRF